MPKAKGLGARKSKARTEILRVCADGEVTGRIRHLDAALAQAQREDRESNKPDRAPKIAREIRELEEAAEAATVEITFRGIGDAAWRRLLGEHPPSKDQIRRAREDGVGKPMFNVDTFPQAAVAACIVAIDGEECEESAETVTEFFEPLPGELARAFRIASEVSNGANTVPFSHRASQLLDPSEESSQSAEPTESATPTS